MMNMAKLPTMCPRTIVVAGMRSTWVNQTDKRGENIYMIVEARIVILFYLIFEEICLE